jgi:hypothetical protein
LSDRGPTTREPPTGDTLASEPSARELVKTSAASLEELDARSDRARRRRARAYLWRTVTFGLALLGPFGAAVAASRLALVPPIVAFSCALAVFTLCARWDRERIGRFRRDVSAGSPDARRALREGAEVTDSWGALPTLDFRLLFEAIDSGELALFEQVVDRRAATGHNADPLAVSLRAIALTLRGFTTEAKALLATVEPDEGWNRLAQATIIRAEGGFVAELPAANTMWLDQRALRTLIDALSRPPANAYRAQRTPAGRYAFRAWLERFCPALVIEPPPYRVSADEHPATWDYASETPPARRPRPLSPDAIALSWAFVVLAATGASWLLSLIPRHDGSIPVVGLLVSAAVLAGTRFADQRSPTGRRRLRRLRASLGDPRPATATRDGETAASVAARIADDVALDGQLDRAADVAETVVLTSFESQRIEDPVPEWPTFSAAIEHIAWANRRDLAEALLALAEKLRGESYGALRFHTRLALALASGDRARAIAIACDLPDEIELCRHAELVAHALQAIALVPAERDRVLRRIELEPLTHARLCAAAPWVLEALATKSLPDDAQ